ncbi:hypothetical protein EGJ27_23850 [Pseudomonas sp. v388]|uniref:DUF6124 family protein n=1 Tax=Pseudomonas sp. v388 TaxID=2479849 RepID=UPI000F7BA626|nr:hypothetical protein [Pseudomonas sp. v388]RRV03931.1 hypothetical protein EGJ27_23850 [Pseudomonas sp. v388]
MMNVTADTLLNSTATTPVLDESIVKRALACYLPTATKPESCETALNHALEFLRCAAATAYELGDSLQGSKRDLAFASMHMMEMARVMVEQSLEVVERR